MDYLIPMGTGDRFFHGVVIDPSDEQEHLAEIGMPT
jgi:hypothetical protein